MGGFTRLLHSGRPDEYMDEIPTIVVDPLPPELQRIANVSGGPPRTGDVARVQGWGDGRGAAPCR